MKLVRWVVLLATALALVAAPDEASKRSKTKQSATTSQTASSATSVKQIDINSASDVELKTLPGIGDAYSAAIIQHRPYENKRQLVSRKVIPQATYDKIVDRIIAKQGGKK